MKTKQRKKPDSKEEKSNKKSLKAENINSSDESKDEEEPKNKNFNVDFKRIVIRCAIIIGVIVLVNFSQGKNLETFASESEEIKLKDSSLQCSEDYVRQLKKYSGCAPKKCGRFVTDTFISLSEVQALAIIAEKGLSLAGPGGGYMVLDLHSGALEKGSLSLNVYKKDSTHKIISSEDLKIYKYVADKVKSFIVDYFGLQSEHLYLTKPTFFIHIDSLIPQNTRDEYWHPRVNKAAFKSFDYTSHLYLTDYNHHFKGGRFVFADKDANRTIEPKVGRLVAFTTGSENTNFVEQVTSGTRTSVTISFSCNPKQGIKELKFPN